MQANEVGTGPRGDDRVGFDVRILHPGGRIGRQQFAYIFVLCVIGFVLCSLGMQLVKPTVVALLSYLAGCALLFFAWASAAIQRLHDLGRPTTDFLFTFIPVYNLYVLFQLLFFRRKTAEPAEAGIWYARGWALLRPITLLLLPALLFGMGLAYQPHKYEPLIPIGSRHYYYNEGVQFSADLPGVTGLSNWAIPTGEKPFSECTREDFSKLSETYGTAGAFSKVLPIEVNFISNYKYRLQDINGKKFVHVTLTRQDDGQELIQHFLFCREDGVEYRFCLTAFKGDKLITHLNIWLAIQSIRVGKDVIP